MNISYSPVIVEKFVSGDFEVAGFKTVLLTQMVTKYYGGVPNPLFPEIPVGKPYTSKRTFLMKNLPEAATIAMIQARIPKTAMICETISHSPIISDNLQYGIDTGKTTVDKIKSRQIVQAIDKVTGELVIILDKKNLKPMYRLTEFCMDATEDIDLRTYTPNELAAFELRKASAVEQDI